MTFLSSGPLLATGLAALLSVVAPSLLAQNRTAQEVQGQTSITTTGDNNSISIRSFNASNVGLKGSPMLEADWVPGEVTLQSGKRITNGLVNYDAYERQVMIKTSPTDSVRYMGRGVTQLIMQPIIGTPVRFIHFTNLATDDVALKNELVRVIHEGTYSLVELPVRTFAKAQARPAYGGQPEVFDEFRDESAYYLIRPDHTAEKIKLTRKSLATALTDKADAFDRYVKDNKLDVKREADAARALASLDQK